MAHKVLIFGTDDLYPKFKPLYDAEVQRGNFEIVSVVNDTAKLAGDFDIKNFDFAIISSNNNFYQRMKFLEAQGFPRSQIIDGRVFQVPNLNFPRLFKEGIACGVIEKQNSFTINNTIYPQRYSFKNNNSTFFLDKKSYISDNASIERNGDIRVGKYSSLSWNIMFEFELNIGHNKENVMQYSRFFFDWTYPKEFMSPQGKGQILIGNDVWIGRGCFFKCTPENPLVIGDGAIVASDSVVVKNVPPYAIVGGNPAQIIKFRFSEDVIESFLRIKWWDWDIDKIYDNFKYFNDIDKFIALHDKELTS